MNDLFKFALDQNADQVFAILDSMGNISDDLFSLKDNYENGLIDDAELCLEVKNILEKK